MIWPKRAAMTIALIVFASVASAEQWNDRTTLKFDAPVMIPGKTLPAGTYLFKLFDSDTNRHIVQVFNEDETTLVATVPAVPAKRMEPRGHVVLKLNPTEAGAPAAIKAWFYPGSMYGHEFIYPDHQAREIAQRTKTLVLSTDIEDSDAEKGTLYTYDAQGRKQPWDADEAMLKEWQQWNEEGRRTTAARLSTATQEDADEATAPLIRHQPAGMKVSIGDLEDDPDRYVGHTINVTAEVDDVFGPRLFKIDEPNWGDLDGEVLVYLPSEFAAMVRDEDRVTVTGTMKTFIAADIERELAWLERDPDLELEFADRPVLVASHIVGGNNDAALIVRVAKDGKQATGNTDETKPVGTSGTSRAALTDAAALSRGTSDLVGRYVDLDAVRVDRMAKNHGFWIDAGGRSVFVLPAQHATGERAAAIGQSVSIDGIVLEMPGSMRDIVKSADDANDVIYVYATTVK